VHVYDVGVWNERVFVAMELVDGQTLRDWARRRGAHGDWRPTLALFVAAGRGLMAAHLAGLVHRDFKPDNVLVGSDGRARVTDFGLARPSGTTPPKDEPPTLSPSRLQQRVTNTGAFVGTPAYMAPEQMFGEPSDARADIFSFCVALWEALYGERPFVGKDVPSLMTAIGADRLQAPRARKVPSWIEAVLRRGLKADPAARFATMEALLAALTRDPTLPLRRALLAALPLVVALALFVGYRRLTRAPACPRADGELAGVWDDTRRGTMTTAFSASPQPYARDVLHSATRLIDQYASGWLAMHKEACEATRVRGDQSEELLDLRMQCLSERLHELKAATDQLVSADAKAIERAVNVAGSLPPVDLCADAVALRAPIRPPRDAAIRARVESVRVELANVRALQQVGKYGDALKRGVAAVASARATNYRPLEAEALEVQGIVQLNSGDYVGARATLLATVTAAEAGRHDLIAASAWISLVWQAYFSAHYPEGHESADHARACIERLGGNETLTIRLERILGSLYCNERDFKAAREHLDRALALAEKRLGPMDLDVARLLSSLGEVSHYQDALAEGGRELKRALEIREKVLGPSHPEVGQSLNNLANSSFGDGRWDEALQLYQRALTIYMATTGPDHPNAATTINNIGRTQFLKGEYDEALTTQLRGLRLHEKIYGLEHPQVATSCNNIAETLLALHRADDSLQYAERALAILRKALGPEHQDTARSLTIIGRAELERHAAAAAVSPLEHALALRESHATMPLSLADTRFALARALWATGREPARARSLAEQAKQTYVANPVFSVRDRVQVEAELAKHAAPR
jgi:tetratricopeptide (TPR) repeat protein